MRNVLTIFVIIFAVFLIGCKPEPDALLKLEIYNTSSANILVQRNILGHSDTLFILVPIEGFFSASNSAMGGDVPSLFGGTMRADSLIVVFNDSLKIIHLPRMEGTWGAIGFEGRSDIIWHNQPRSLMNLDSYTQEDRGDGRNEHIIARYYFTDEDLEHAISVYE